MNLETAVPGFVDRATDALRAMILDGRLEAHASLKQDELARKLNLSRTPLRYALQRLAREGLIRAEHHRSAVVVPMTQGDVEDLFDMRVALEPLALSAAFARLDKVCLALAEQCLGDASATTSQLDLAAANWNFHAALYAPCVRPMLLSVVADLNVRATRAVVIGLSVQARPESSHNEHTAILRACRDRNEPKAVGLLVEHLRQARAAVLAAIGS